MMMKRPDSIHSEYAGYLQTIKQKPADKTNQGDTAEAFRPAGSHNFKQHQENIKQFKYNKYNLEMSKRTAAGERNQPVTSICVHVFVSRAKLLRQEPGSFFQETFLVLEQVVIAGRLFYDHARPKAVRRTQQQLQQFHLEVFDQPVYSPNLAFSDYHLFQHRKSSTASSISPVTTTAVTG
ncbi:hypothetical protein AVEN_142617-1 [Araneus ventricosus]|uniref:Uncharacterized protein n=1 Tax=Araneus ventricosus TaxID=182803 RepID=A0A4Y2G6Y9_ARAVE|nr:hypothetical protein AVEN_142617-1 [Araneus ventricosus]